MDNGPGGAKAHDNLVIASSLVCWWTRHDPTEIVGVDFLVICHDDYNVSQFLGASFLALLLE